VPSASGSKYQSGDIMFWSKGESAMLQIGGEVFSNCRLVD
jgi:membrane-bound inhibitor of C-type lysozyme